ncbi:MAG: heme ABC transporter ATP-binding protein [Acidimicrobiia bacterium]|nr:heme ABC transporter ATP-binding protein [Acidimicrobiia bacterium]NNF63455.1 heme ABC transporter ATP-binding protein [Acidimicrobiia bacterium]
MPDAITAAGLTYRVKDAVLVSDVDFRAGWGELVVIIGPNGAGKSTLLSLLAGDLHPSAGTASVDGLSLGGAATAELATVRAVLSQRTPIDVPFTAAEVVEMGRFPHRRNAANSSELDATVVGAAMDRTDTRRFSGRIFSTLSGGERTRVSLARVLAQDTPVIYLDEPTTALDVAHQERMMRQIAALAAEGRCVVTVLHDLNAAAVYADRIVLMSEGSVVAEGSPRDVLRTETLSETYGHPMKVIDHPLHDCPLVLPG